MDEVRCPKCGSITTEKICPSCGEKIIARNFLGASVKFGTLVQITRLDALKLKQTRFGSANRYIDATFAEAEQCAALMNRTVNIPDFFTAYENIMFILNFMHVNHVRTSGMTPAANIRKINGSLAGQEVLLLDRAFRKAITDRKGKEYPPQHLHRNLAYVFEEISQCSSQFEEQALEHANERLKEHGLFHQFFYSGKSASTPWRKKY